MHSSQKTEQNTNIELETLPQHKKAMDTFNIDFLGPSQISSISDFLSYKFWSTYDQDYIEVKFSFIKPKTPFLSHFF